jgi:hypothetical protein
MELTEIQNQVVEALTKRGFRINMIQAGDESEGPTVYMSRRVKHYRTHYAEVDDTGLVNGQSLEKFTL